MVVLAAMAVFSAVFTSCKKEENPIIPPPPPSPSYSYKMLDSLYNTEAQCLQYNTSDYVFLDQDGDTISGINSGCGFMTTPTPPQFKAAVNGLYNGVQFYTDTTRNMKFVVLAASKVGAINAMYKYYRMERFTDGAALYIEGTQILSDHPNPHPRSWEDKLILKFYEDDHEPTALYYGLYETANGNITFYYP